VQSGKANSELAHEVQSGALNNELEHVLHAGAARSGFAQVLQSGAARSGLMHVLHCFFGSNNEFLHFVQLVLASNNGFKHDLQLDAGSNNLFEHEVIREHLCTYVYGLRVTSQYCPLLGVDSKPTGQLLLSLLLVTSDKQQLPFRLGSEQL
jgi:hypothetical protein